MDKRILLYFYNSPLGKMTMSSDGNALTGLWFEGQKYFGADFPKEKIVYEQKELPIFGETIRWLDLYFSGKEPDFLPELSLNGTEFRKEVWKLLLEIPYGETVTYGEIAGKIAKKKGLLTMSAQAVGGAVGHNPISILVPCHRVVGSDGSLTGYAGGLDKKLALLTLEQKNHK